MKRAFVLCLLFAVRAVAQTPSIDERVDALLAQMTLEEKLGQLSQYTPGKADINAIVAKGGAGSLFGFGSVLETNTFQRIAVEQSRLKIPLLFGHDVIHGYRTIFPIPPGLASTWDPESVELAARIAAREAAAIGIRWTFSPMVDIARDPRWGRIAEGAGEDPFLGSAIAAAYVRGYQGRDLSASDSILSCAKHFAAYGAAEAGRDYNTTDMSERTLREIYLPPFKAAVDAGVWTLMTSFNSLNGVPATANPQLLTKILRDEWQFRGFVVSDYTAIEELIKHGVAGSLQEAGVKAITSGVDMAMVDGSFMTLAAAVNDGRVPMAVVDRAVRRILRAKFALGLFERPYVDDSREKTQLLTKEHVDAARRIAAKSIVLLKNEREVLPVAKGIKTLAVIGPLSDSKEDLLGSWSAGGKPEEAVTLLEGVRAKVSPSTRVLHANGGEVLRASDEDIAGAVSIARQSDTVILILGEEGKMSGEANSRAYLDLPGRQQRLLEEVVAAGKPVALVVMSGRPLTIGWAADNVPAIVWGWFPGTQGGHALADILFGDVNPSGRLPVTIPRTLGQVPIYYNSLPTGRPEDPDQRYTTKYIDAPNAPLYPFGHGLSYTRFEYSNLTTRVDGSRVVVSADVKNAGARAGDDVVQLYINDPVASTSRPVRELKGFRRVTLAPGETKRVELTVPRDDLRFWTERGWTFEPGAFRVWMGSLAGTFELQ
jgi:beta-glucosidase